MIVESIVQFRGESALDAVVNHHSLHIVEEEGFRNWLALRGHSVHGLSAIKLDALFHEWEPQRRFHENEIVRLAEGNTWVFLEKNEAEAFVEYLENEGVIQSRRNQVSMIHRPGESHVTLRGIAFPDLEKVRYAATELSGWVEGVVKRPRPDGRLFLQEFREKSGKVTVRVWLFLIQSLLTQYDAKLEASGDENRYRLLNWVKALGKVESRMRRNLKSDTAKMRAKLIRELKKEFIFERGHFGIPPLDKAVKQMADWETKGLEPTITGPRAVFDMSKLPSKPATSMFKVKFSTMTGRSETRTYQATSAEDAAQQAARGWYSNARMEPAGTGGDREGTYKEFRFTSGHERAWAYVYEGVVRESWRRPKPKAAELARAFQISDAEANQVLRLLQPYLSDRAAEDALEKVDKIIGGFGVETIRGGGITDRFWMDAKAAYVNMGDTYSTTILYDTEEETFELTTWGDWLEYKERQGMEFESKKAPPPSKTVKEGTRRSLEIMGKDWGAEIERIGGTALALTFPDEESAEGFRELLGIEYPEGLDFNVVRRGPKVRYSFVNIMDSVREAAPSEGGFKLNCATVPLAKARAYAESIIPDLDVVLPDFDRNYMELQKKLKKALAIPRIDMPVIEPKDMGEFDKRLKSGRIDIFAPYTKGKMPKVKAPAWPMPPKEGEEWVELGVKDGHPTDDVVKAKWTRMAAKDLIPTQDQIWLEKLIGNIAKWGPPKAGSPVLDTTIIVSIEGYILDGHHRFGQVMLADPSLRLKALFIPLDIKTLLDVGRSYGAAIGRAPKENVNEAYPSSYSLRFKFDRADDALAFAADVRDVFPNTDLIVAKSRLLVVVNPHGLSSNDVSEIIEAGKANNGEFYRDTGPFESKVQEYEEAPECPACGGPGMELGRLGNMTHYRCRRCGMDFNIRESTFEQEMKRKWREMRGEPVTEVRPGSPVDIANRREEKIKQGIIAFAKKYKLGPIRDYTLNIDARGQIMMLLTGDGYEIPDSLKRIVTKAVIGKEQVYLPGMDEISGRWIKMNHFAWEKLLREVMGIETSHASFESATK